MDLQKNRLVFLVVVITVFAACSPDVVLVPSPAATAPASPPPANNVVAPAKPAAEEPKGLAAELERLIQAAELAAKGDSSAEDAVTRFKDCSKAYPYLRNAKITDVIPPTKQHCFFPVFITNAVTDDDPLARTSGLMPMKVGGSPRPVLLYLVQPRPDPRALGALMLQHIFHWELMLRRLPGETPTPLALLHGEYDSAMVATAAMDRMTGQAWSRTTQEVRLFSYRLLEIADVGLVYAPNMSGWRKFDALWGGVATNARDGRIRDWLALKAVALAEADGESGPRIINALIVGMKSGAIPVDARPESY